MRKFLGAWLCLTLGTVLITTGLASGGTGAVGEVTVIPCAPTEVGIANPCPTAVVTVNETTAALSGSIAPAVSPPAGGWTIHVTSPCASTVDGTTPMDETFTVADGGSADSAALYAFADTSDSTKCVYTLTETPVVGFTAAWDPANTFTLTVNNDGIAENASVKLTNSAVVTTPTTTAPAPTTASRTSTAPASSTAPRSSTRATTPARTSASPSAGASGALAATGPHRRIDTTLIVGIAVIALGLVLLVAGRVERRRGHHRS